MLHSRNNELWKIDQGSRLLLRELTYASLITSYVDNIVSDEDKTEALQALMQVFKSMADVTSRILVGAVAARRAIHIEDLAFKNNAAENKLLVQTTLNPKLFCGKYFDILHASAESMRDAKETQHLRGSKQRDGSALSSARKRKRDDSVGTSEPKEQQSSFANEEDEILIRKVPSEVKLVALHKIAPKVILTNQLETQLELQKSGCRIISYHREWMKITSDDWILKIVQEGLKLVFIKHPPNTGVRITNVQDVVQRQCILEEIESLLGKHAIEIVPKTQEGQGFYSTFFVVPKRDGGYRPILNLKPLNVFLQNQHFKIESLRSITQALNVGDWVASIDLKDAYLHVPIYPEDRKYLRFCIDNIHYQFRSMPFGLATAPRVFTKLMGAIGAHLTKKSKDFHLYVPGRLASQKCRSNDISSSTKENFVSADGLGPGNKSIQVNSATNATDNLPWSTIQPPTGYGLPQFGPFSQSA
uniref:Reverse transcriptase domain-containing protein n=1 Tax=Magallana gigas TaxID=29159 RepID=A0A8W8IEM8_MAGGI